ncbi:tyrosine-type recombinase/integrase [Methylocystis sp. WRRC1]|uniref:tyrosine-type recombinase/integrase n=1 Tax=Methylocystis sp. WRRC1 TaxID=1732014 RepID=UPI001D152E52|nr:tyrosine-type recombinase/integrase [Methylocystis sp. WRRC1]MCC3246737.1 tyrosine-type recombinase/integrase [Methylocystis sp. WRRC1]
MRSDPTQGVDRAATTGDGFHVWSEEEIEKYEAHWPIGTRERLWLAVFLYTGLRRGDAASLRHDQIKNGVILMRAEKNKAQLAIPILPELQAVIDASPKGETTLISTHGGKPLTKESLGNLFREACMAAGVPGRAHGLRKAGATRAANNGATERELEAIFGWHGGKMAAHYTRAADRERLAKQAIGKVVKPKG